MTPDLVTNYIQVSKEYIEKRKKLEKRRFIVGGIVEDKNILEARFLIKTCSGVFSHVIPKNPPEDYPFIHVFNSSCPCAVLYSDGKLERVNLDKKSVVKYHKKLEKSGLFN